MEIEEIKIKKALNRLHSNFLPYKWDLNVYRGCSHRCQYCYALYSHKYLENGKNFFDTIYVKTNIVEALEKELSSKRWKHEVINLGGVTDSYQLIEEKYGLMREVLKLMIKYKTPIVISTKSDLILRDMDLLEELAKVTSVNVAVTIITMDENIRKQIEPGARPSEKRLEVLKQLAGKNIGLGLHLMPILPMITDSEENIENIFREVSKIPIDYAICGFLNLRSATRVNFLDFIKLNFPNLFDDYLKLYQSPFIKKEYARNVYEKIWRLKRKYNIKSDYKKVLPKNNSSQLKLFIS
ncbi:MAG TPA: radical SAM protein [Candidatus Woesebacteria bacterium]|nr:radical SAM protein [Candidatus Woesebacteria bacterium]